MRYASAGTHTGAPYASTAALDWKGELMLEALKQNRQRLQDRIAADQKRLRDLPPLARQTTMIVHHLGILHDQLFECNETIRALQNS